MEVGKWKGLEGAEVKGVEKSRGAARLGVMIRYGGWWLRTGLVERGRNNQKTGRINKT